MHLHAAGGRCRAAAFAAGGHIALSCALGSPSPALQSNLLVVATPRPRHRAALLASRQIAKLLIERRAFESRLLVESLVVVGRRLGVLNIEKYVIALDLADQVEAIKEIYYRISPDVDQTTFFRHKGWYYDRSAASEREARAAEADAEAEPRAEPD